MSVEAQQISCDENLIAAYIDGELDFEGRIAVELHLADCDDCQVSLRAHRIFVCELDSVLTQSHVDVPLDFSRQVAARASSDMRGIRSASENKKALAFCVVLALASLALLSETSRVAAFSTTREIFRTVFAAIGVLWVAIYDMAASVTVISRVLSRKLIVESNSLGLLLFLFALAILLLSRMIIGYRRTNYHRANYHRTGATE